MSNAPTTPQAAERTCGHSTRESRPSSSTAPVMASLLVIGAATGCGARPSRFEACFVRSVERLELRVAAPGGAVVVHEFHPDSRAARDFLRQLDAAPAFHVEWPVAVTGTVRTQGPYGANLRYASRVDVDAVRRLPDATLYRPPAGRPPP